MREYAVVCGCSKVLEVSQALAKGPYKRIEIMGLCETCDTNDKRGKGFDYSPCWKGEVKK